MKIITTILFCLVTDMSFAQTNLVPNGDFEQYSFCPNSGDLIIRAIPWLNPTTTSPDYFNECNTLQGNGLIGVPNNYLGNESGHSGVGYAGIVTGIGGREYIEIQLTEVLDTNKKYRVEFYVSLSDSCWSSCNSFGVYFSNVIVTSNLAILPYVPQINNRSTNLLNNKHGWTLVSDTFTASGGESFLTIGNFTPDSLIDTTYVGNGGGMSPPYLIYYYIDDVSVVMDSLTSIPEFDKSEIDVTILPNPFNDKLQIIDNRIKKYPIKLMLYNLLGEKLLEDTFTEIKNLETSALPSGVYFVKIIEGDYSVVKKIIKR